MDLLLPLQSKIEKERFNPVFKDNITDDIKTLTRRIRKLTDKNVDLSSFGIQEAISVYLTLNHGYFVVDPSNDTLTSFELGRTSPFTSIGEYRKLFTEIGTRKDRENPNYLLYMYSKSHETSFEILVKILPSSHSKSYLIAKSLNKLRLYIPTFRYAYSNIRYRAVNPKTGETRDFMDSQWEAYRNEMSLETFLNKESTDNRDIIKIILQIILSLLKAQRYIGYYDSGNVINSTMVVKKDYTYRCEYETMNVEFFTNYVAIITPTDEAYAVKHYTNVNDLRNSPSDDNVESKITRELRDVMNRESKHYVYSLLSNEVSVVQTLFSELSPIPLTIRSRVALFAEQNKGLIKHIHEITKNKILVHGKSHADYINFFDYQYKHSVEQEILVFNLLRKNSSSYLTFLKDYITKHFKESYFSEGVKRVIQHEINFLRETIADYRLDTIEERDELHELLKRKTDTIKYKIRHISLTPTAVNKMIEMLYKIDYIEGDIGLNEFKLLVQNIADIRFACKTHVLECKLEQCRISIVPEAYLCIEKCDMLVLKFIRELKGGNSSVDVKDKILLCVYDHYFNQ